MTPEHNTLHGRLTYEQAEEIRALRHRPCPTCGQFRTERSLARQFRVSVAAVSKIVNNLTHRRHPKTIPYDLPERHENTMTVPTPYARHFP